MNHLLALIVSYAINIGPGCRDRNNSNLKGNTSWTEVGVSEAANQSGLIPFVSQLQNRLNESIEHFHVYGINRENNKMTRMDEGLKNISLLSAIETKKYKFSEYLLQLKGTSTGIGIKTVTEGD